MAKACFMLCLFGDPDGDDDAFRLPLEFRFMERRDAPGGLETPETPLESSYVCWFGTGSGSVEPSSASDG